MAGHPNLPHVWVLDPSIWTFLHCLCLYIYPSSGSVLQLEVGFLIILEGPTLSVKQNANPTFLNANPSTVPSMQSTLFLPIASMCMICFRTRSDRSAASKTSSLPLNIYSFLFISTLSSHVYAFPLISPHVYCMFFLLYHFLPWRGAVLKPSRLERF